MKSLRFILPAVLMSTTTMIFAQMDIVRKIRRCLKVRRRKKSFDQTGKPWRVPWEAIVTTVPPAPEMEGQLVQVSFRVTSRGNAIVHEMKGAGTPDDPAKYDHPLTMLYLDSDRLLLTHYCDAGNRPSHRWRHLRRTGKKEMHRLVLEFLDLAGGTEYGHMHHAVFTAIDANHHTEDWTYMMPGDKPMHAHMDLQRTK